MAILDNRFTTSLIFEVQDECYSEWSTSTIAFIAKNSKYDISGIGIINRNNRFNEARNLCYREVKRYKLLP